MADHPLRRRTDVLETATGHAAVHVVAVGVGGTCAGHGKLVGSRTHPHLRPPPQGRSLARWTLPFSFLINPAQQTAQYVSCRELPKERTI
jgi:hypothetical protein